MLENFDCYWNVIHGVLAVVAILDLRYEIKLLKCYFSILW